MGMLMYAGYLGGAAMLPENVGGQGFNAWQAHQIMAPFIEPISIAIIILLLGIILGGVGFLLTYNRKSTIKRNNIKEYIFVLFINLFCWIFFHY
jgi:hypothetical protein